MYALLRSWDYVRIFALWWTLLAFLVVWRVYMTLWGIYWFLWDQGLLYIYCLIVMLMHSILVHSERGYCYRHTSIKESEPCPFWFAAFSHVLVCWVTSKLEPWTVTESAAVIFNQIGPELYLSSSDELLSEVWFYYQLR